MTSIKLRQVSPDGRPDRPGFHRRPMAHAAAALLAGGVALGLGLWLGGGLPDSQVAGLVDAGLFTAWGLPISRLVVDVSAVGTVGMLVTAILLPRQDGGRLCDEARRCLRTAGSLALVWAVSAVAMLVFSWSDETALRVTELPLSQVLAGADASFPDAVPYLFCAVLAFVIAAGASAVQTLQGAVGVLVLCGYNLLPLTTTGHAQHSRIIAYALTVHVVALTLWVGGLGGLLVHVRRSPALLAVAVPRFSRLALCCFIAVGASGVTMAWVNVGSLGELWGSGYGWLVVCKATALITLGFFGWSHRRRTVPAVKRRHGRAFVRLAAVEVVVMATTVAIAVALSRAPTPDTSGVEQHVHAAARPVSSSSLSPSAPDSAPGEGTVYGP